MHYALQNFPSTDCLTIWLTSRPVLMPLHCSLATTITQVHKLFAAPLNSIHCLHVTMFYTYFLVPDLTQPFVLQVREGQSLGTGYISFHYCSLQFPDRIFEKEIHCLYMILPMRYSVLHVLLIADSWLKLVQQFTQAVSKATKRVRVS